MPDRSGAVIAAGDCAILHVPDNPDLAVGVTVLREIEQNRYLVQMDPPQPKGSIPKGLSQLEGTIAKLHSPGNDLQEPMVVRGDDLELLWDDADLDLQDGE